MPRYAFGEVLRHHAFWLLHKCIELHQAHVVFRSIQLQALRQHTAYRDRLSSIADGLDLLRNDIVQPAGSADDRLRLNGPGVHGEQHGDIYILVVYYVHKQLSDHLVNGSTRYTLTVIGQTVFYLVTLTHVLGFQLPLTLMIA